MIEVTDAEQIERLNSRVMELLRERDAMVAALEKVRSYNVDIAAGRINYRPHDHIQVIDEALAVVERGKET